MSNLAELKNSTVGLSVRERTKLLREKEKQSGFVPTPEYQEKVRRQAKAEHDKQVRVAKSRAARYNMTLRALALKQTQDEKSKKVAEQKAVQENKERAAKYNMTSRALDISRNQKERQKELDDKKKIEETKKRQQQYNMTNRALDIKMVKQDKRVLGKALGIDVMPGLAGDVIKAVAENQAEEVPDDEEVVVDEEDMLETEKMGLETDKEEPLETEKEEPLETEKEDQDDLLETEKIVMGDLNNVLESGDDGAINRSIIAQYLETHAPDELPNLETYLKEYKDNPHELFDMLIEKYEHSPDDAAIEGEQKAAREVAGDVNEETWDDDFKNAEELEADDASVVEDIKTSYEDTIKEAEADPEKAKELSMKHSVIEKNNEELSSALDGYKKKRESRISSVMSRKSTIASIDSLVPVDPNSGYITEIKAEPKKKDSPTGATTWAVEIKSQNHNLVQKLEKQGMSKKDAQEMADMLTREENTSEML